MRVITNCLSAAVLASLLGVITPSQAQVGPCATCKAAPGPLAGAGLPVLVVAGRAYWVVRRLRRKRY
jgi:hypothetical protein